jgi:predicted glutamine amidotransferase
MCGIFGFAGPQSYRAASLLQALAIADETRGKHSTGLAIAAREEGSRRLSPHIVKKALSGSEFVRAGWSQVLFTHKYPLAIGHNRYATAGAVNDRNAHPFTIPTPHGIAIAAHNGMVGGKELLAEKFGVKDRPVDSEVFFRAIGRKAGHTEKDLLDSIEEVVRFTQPRADFACLWMEPTWRSLYFWRSNERPLAIFDARKMGLGRFLCSTVPIFSNAWGMIRGCLPSLKKVSYFEAKPLAIYRVKDDADGEVEKLREIKIPDSSPAASEPAVPRQQILPGCGERGSPFEDEEDPRIFFCSECHTVVAAEEAVHLDGRGRRSSVGRAVHEDCVPDSLEPAPCPREDREVI